ncbi:MAG: M20 aminoacylase family protein [Beijerinckiaceae bacterium]
MPIVNRVAELADEVAAWRQDFHQHPELLFEVHRTAGVVAEKLKEFGCDEVVTGIGRTGVVGVIKGRKGDGPTIGLRADMDALPIPEATSVAYKSKNPGLMHACGHDGHTAMLLGAAQYLTETRNFAGTAVVIFQPAEEGGGGGREMVADGVMERFGVKQVYGMHNAPGVPVGVFAIRKGALMASADRFEVEITGRGGHAAKPNECIDPIVAGSQIVNALQTIASRTVDPIDSVVVSVTQFHAGTANNIIPQTARLTGTIRALKNETRALAKKRFHDIVDGVAALNGCEAKIDFEDGYPVTVNHAEETDFAVKVAREVAGADRVMADMPPVMGAEDFSYMLEARPGAFIFIGNGATAGLHHPQYDFNDQAIPLGVSYWARLVENALPG